MPFIDSSHTYRNNMIDATLRVWKDIPQVGSLVDESRCILWVARLCTSPARFPDFGSMVIMQPGPNAGYNRSFLLFNKILATWLKPISISKPSDEQRHRAIFYRSSELFRPRPPHLHRCILLRNIHGILKVWGVIETLGLALIEDLSTMRVMMRETCRRDHVSTEQLHRAGPQSCWSGPFFFFFFFLE